MEDRKGVGRIIGRCNQPIIVAVPENRRIAIAGEDAGRDILGQ